MVNTVQFFYYAIYVWDPYGDYACMNSREFDIYACMNIREFDNDCQLACHCHSDNFIVKKR